MTKVTKENLKQILKEKFIEDQEACKELEINPEIEFPNNEELIKHIIDNFGFISIKEYGLETFGNMALLVQHLDNTEDNNKYRLRYLNYFKSNLIDPKIERDADIIELFYDFYALLTDRYLLYTGRKQLYGTQYSINPITKNKTLDPVEDPENLNKRRAALGLVSHEEYLKG